MKDFYLCTFQNQTFFKKNFIISLPQISLAATIDRICFPGGSGVKNPPASAGDAGSIPRSGRVPGEEIGNPLQHSCWGSSMEPGGGSPWGTKESDMTERLNNNCFLEDFLVTASTLRALTVGFSS